MKMKMGRGERVDERAERDTGALDSYTTLYRYARRQGGYDWTRPHPAFFGTSEGY